MYIQIESDRTLNESVWTEINWSQWYELKLMWNRNPAYPQPKNCFVNCLRTYIVQSCIFPWNKNPMKYDVVRFIIQASKLQKVFIFLDVFLANNIAPKCSSKIMYISLGTISWGYFQSFNRMKNRTSPGKSQYS